MGNIAYEEYYTVDDYNQWEGDWELIYGMPYAMAPSPMFDHQYLSGKIFRILDEQLDACPRSFPAVEIDWQVSDDIVVRPDVLVVCKREQRITSTPEIIFEVVSGSSVKRDEQTKFTLYEKEGVKYYALVYPEHKRVKIYQHIDFKYRKIGDFSNEGAFKLHIRECDVQFDTGILWKKF
jgi:Uma2 family endonuclease